MVVVVDTNVAVVANGRSEQASADCVKTCAERLREIMRGNVKLVLDNRWIILREYMQNLHTSGDDVGDRFLGWVLRSLKNPDNCELVKITPIEDSEREFKEFPDDPDIQILNPKKDRKFIAVAIAHCEKPPILQAVDSKWLDFSDVLSRHGVTVEFICEEDIQRLYDGD